LLTRRKEQTSSKRLRARIWKRGGDRTAGGIEQEKSWKAPFHAKGEFTVREGMEGQRGSLKTGKQLRHYERPWPEDRGSNDAATLQDSFESCSPRGVRREKADRGNEEIFGEKKNYR